MTQQQPGKLSRERFEQTIFAHLGAEDADVVVGPEHGVDFGLVRIGEGRVMAITSDPVFVVPAYGWERAAWFAAHILASDVAVSGLPLRWMAADLNLPLELSDADLATLWESFAATCADLGLAIVAGHTGRYAGCEWPMVGGAVCIAVGDEDAYVTPGMAEVGDVVVVTKGAAIEATALFGATFPDRLAAELGDDVADAADALFESMTVVPDALVATAYGLRDAGVTAMHDATEGGVIGGLAEIATASGVGLVVDQAAIPVRDEVAAVCAHVGIDPYTSISEGTLLATVRPDHVAGVLAAWTDAGIDAAVIGEVLPLDQGTTISVDGKRSQIEPPETDPFWEAFGRWTQEAAAS